MIDSCPSSHRAVFHLRFPVVTRVQNDRSSFPVRLNQKSGKKVNGNANTDERKVGEEVNIVT